MMSYSAEVRIQIARQEAAADTIIVASPQDVASALSYTYLFMKRRTSQY